MFLCISTSCTHFGIALVWVVGYTTVVKKVMKIIGLKT